MNEFVALFEVGPRDGLQNEADLVATDDKVRLINELSKAGFQKIEVTSFVSPKWVPQMADAADVMNALTRHEGTAYAALTPNVKGYHNAKAAKSDEVAIFASASEGFSQKNINCSIAESLERFEPIMKAARRDDIPVRGYVSCVVECPYDGAVAPGAVADIARALLDLGVYQVSLGDTLGRAKPDEIDKMLEVVLGKTNPDQLAGHFHDTHDRALENIDVALEKGLRCFDAAIGGLGGCPYAPGAKGNVETLRVHDYLQGLGYETGLDREALIAAGALLDEILRRPENG